MVISIYLVICFPRTESRGPAQGILGHTSKQHLLFSRILSRWWGSGRKHLLCPCGQQQCNKSGPLPSCPRKRSLCFIQDAKGYLTAMICFRLSRHPQDTLSASLKDATTQPLHNHLPQKEPSFPKPQNALAQTLTLKRSSRSSSAPPCVAWFSVTRGLISTFFV